MYLREGDYVMCIKVAIIDDGINELYISSKCHNYQITEGEVQSLRINNNNIQHNLTHGTICAAIFCNYTSNYEIHSLQIMQSGQHKTNVHHLVTALTWCLTHHIQLVHLSLGSIYFGDFEVINQMISELVSHNVIIVAACNNKNITTMPASLPGVIGVRCDPLGQLGEGQFFYNDTTIHNIEVISGCEYNLKDKKLASALVKCNSFAAPFISATVCNIMQQGSYNIDFIKKELQLKSVKNDNIYTFANYERCIDCSNIIDVPIVTIIDDTNTFASDLIVELIKHFQIDGYHCIGVTPQSTDIAKQLYQIKNYWSDLPFNLWTTLRMIYYTTLCDVIILEVKEEKELQELQQQGFVDLHVHITKEREEESKAVSLNCDLPIVTLHLSDYTTTKLPSVSRALYTKIYKVLDESK